MEAIGRLFSSETAIEAARDRRDRTYGPALADLFVATEAIGSPGSPSWSLGMPCWALPLTSGKGLQ